MINKMIVFILLCFTSFAYTSEQQGPADKQALLDIKVGVELSKLEQSMQNIDQSIQLASQALQEIAKNPNISDEQQAKIIETFEHIDDLSLTFQSTIKEIPATIKQSTPPLLVAIDNLFSNVQLTIIIVLISILIILIIALIAIYYWVIKPTTLMLLKTTSKVDHMANALQTTAKIVEKTTEQQLLILNTITTQQPQNGNT